MATTLVSVETREVVRCEHCRLMQYRTNNSLCRKCHRPLDIEEPVQLAPQLVTNPPVPASAEAGTGGLVTNCGASWTGSSISRGRWHFLHRELLVLYCMSLQCSHRTTSRVSTLTRVVAIGYGCGAPEQEPRGAFFAPRYALLSGK